MFANKTVTRILLGAVLAGLILFGLIQLVPVDRSNPPVETTINWDSPETEALARAACYDCHSNETVWPGYSYVAPVSWLVSHDVQEGREHLNFSEGRIGEVEEMVEEIERGNMPLPIYLPTHPEARLTDADRQVLIDGLWATFGN